MARGELPYVFGATEEGARVFQRSDGRQRVSPGTLHGVGRWFGVVLLFPFLVSGPALSQTPSQTSSAQASVEQSGAEESGAEERSVGDGSAAALLTQPIALLVFERAPYYLRAPDGGYTGLVAGPVAEALTRAHIPFFWRVMEPNGHLRTVQANRGLVCAVGWFYLPERASMGLFTRPVYRDRPQVVLTRVDNILVQDAPTLRDLMTVPGLRMGAKLGYSYGAYVDELIETRRPLRSTVSQDEAGLARMLLDGRFDYMILAFEEAEDLIRHLGEAGKDLVAVSVEDMPAGNARHLLCSRQVGQAVIDKINAALADMEANPQ